MNLKKEWIPGEKAMLNSGGPIMSVKAVDRDGIVCSWFDGSVLYHGVFNVRQLVETNATTAIASVA